MRLASRFGLQLLLGLSSLLGTILGCQYLWRPQGTLPASKKPEYLSTIKVFFETENQAKVFVGEFDRSTCQGGIPRLWSVYVNTVFGEHRFDIDFTAIENSQKREARLQIHPQLYTLPESFDLKNLATANFCQVKDEHAVSLNHQSPIIADILAPLQQLAPDCRFQWKEGGGLHCLLSTPSEAELYTYLESIKKNMSTKWNHQPYLLIRRLTLASQLLQVAQDPGALAERNRACRIMRYSLPTELPLSFRSKLWQNKICEEENIDQNALMLGLHAAAKEIDALSQRVEDASLVGLFTLSVPRDQSPTKDYWITLQPIEAKADLPNEAKATNLCQWHPLFFEKPEGLLIAQTLQILDKTPKGLCSLPATATKNADIYVRSSIASEMEFAISNGQSKRLRLPTGEYTYSISQYSGPFPEELITQEEGAPLSTGQLSWKNAKPHLIIRTWQ